MKLPSWAVEGMLIIPASKRGVAKFAWFGKSDKGPPHHGRVNKVDPHDSVVIHVVMENIDNVACGGMNLWRNVYGQEWSDDDWRPLSEGKQMLLFGENWSDAPKPEPLRRGPSSTTARSSDQEAEPTRSGVAGSRRLARSAR